MFKVFFGKREKRDCDFLDKFATMEDAKEFIDEIMSWEEDEDGDWYLITNEDGDVEERIIVQ